MAYVSERPQFTSRALHTEVPQRECSQLGSPLFDRNYLVQSVLEEDAFQDITIMFGD